MEKRWLLILVVALSAVFMAASLYAGTDVQDVIKMENNAYKKHKKGIVMFSHKKHMDDYAKKAPELYKDGCGACHHDDENKPLADLKLGDEVQGCIECHDKASEKPKGKDAPKLTKEEELEYHAEAMHDNCKGCHKAYNKANKTKAAPTTCAKCHPKTKK